MLQTLQAWIHKKYTQPIVRLGGIGVLTIALGVVSLTVVKATALGELSWQGWFTLGILATAFGLNALTDLAAELIFLGALGLLFLTGILDENTALRGFSNPGLMTVAVLYLVVAGVQQTGVLGWVSQRVLGLPQTPGRAILRLMVPVMGLSAFLNNTPVVALFIPVVNTWSRTLGLSPSKLMIPLSYAAILGGTCTLIGTSTNLLVNGFLITATDHPGMGVLDIAVVGIPTALVGTGFIYATQRWLLPERQSAMTDVEDVRQYTVEMVVEAGGPLVGQTVQQAGLRNLPSVYLAEIVRGGQVIPAVSPRERLQAQDQLVFVGRVDSMVDLHRFRGLQPATDQVFKLDGDRSDRGLVEAVVSDSGPLVGRTIREGRFRSRYGAVVLAVARNGARLVGKLGDIRLRPGDTLLLESTSAFWERQRISRDFYLVSAIPDSEPLRHQKAPLAAATLVIMVVVAALGWVSMLQAAIGAAFVLLLTGCCAPGRALRQVEWPVLIVIGAALALGTAMETTGAAAAIAKTLLDWTGDHPWPALVMIYTVTSLLTEVVTNNAAAALMFPIALSLSQTLGISVMPYAIAIMMAASASFATPIGYQTNLMVYGPGGYRFTDFLRIGIPLNLLCGIVAIVLIPWFYPLVP